MPGGTIEERITSVVTHALAQENGRLLELVDQAVDHALAELVAERLSERSNGNAAIGKTRDISLAGKAELEQRTNGNGNGNGAPRLCEECGERRPQKYRRVCERCRHARGRERRPKPAAARNGDDGPRAGG